MLKKKSPTITTASTISDTELDFNRLAMEATSCNKTKINQHDNDTTVFKKVLGVHCEGTVVSCAKSEDYESKLVDYFLFFCGENQSYDTATTRYWSNGSYGEMPDSKKRYLHKIEGEITAINTAIKSDRKTEIIAIGNNLRQIHIFKSKDADPPNSPIDLISRINTIDNKIAKAILVTSNEEMFYCTETTKLLYHCVNGKTLSYSIPDIGNIKAIKMCTATSIIIVS